MTLSRENAQSRVMGGRDAAFVKKIIFSGAMAPILAAGTLRAA